MTAPETLYSDAPPENHAEDLVPALRGLFSQHPGAMRSSPEVIGRMLYVLCFLSYRPALFEVEAALEALRIDGELAA